MARCRQGGKREVTRQPSPEISSAVQRWHRLHWTSAFRAHEYREALLDLLAVSRARTFRELTDTLEFGLSEVHDAFRRNELALDDYLRQITEAIEGLGPNSRADRSRCLVDRR